MLNLFNKFIVSRLLVTTEILTVIAAILLAETIPQRFMNTADTLSQWRLQHAWLVSLADVLHLHAVYTSYWFVSIVALVGASLVFSSVAQIRMTRSRIKAFITSGEILAVFDSMNQELAQKIASTGYRQQTTGQEEVFKFIRCKWGYWGTMLFHIGMVVVIGASFYIALTERRGAISIVQREMLAPDDEWRNTEEGLLAKKLRLPATFRYDDLIIRYDEKDIPEHIESLVTFLRSDGSEEQKTVAVNAVSRYQGLRVYHTNEYGDAFSVELIQPDGTRHFEKLLIEHPTGLNEAGYLDTRLSWLPFTLSLKYVTDAEHRSMSSTNRQITMRLMAGKQETARVTLQAGQSGQLGDYQVRLHAVEKWAKLIIVDVHGMPVVFVGFALMVLGAMLSYMTPPREIVIICQKDGIYTAYWRATRFAEFYAEERSALAKVLQPEK
jgi:cytochrome c biogenesis protein